jgi:hypothetical protein
MGFGLIEVLIVVAVVVILGGAGTYNYHRDHKAEPTTTTSSTSTKSSTQPSKSNVATTPAPTYDSYADWSTYANQQAGLTFKYPSTWTSQVNPNSTYTTGSSFAGVSGTITSPSENALTWVYLVVGGKGGDCTPNPSDIPFAPGDKCASKQIVSVEQLQSVKPPTGKTFRNLFGDSLYITETKFDGGPGFFAGYPNTTALAARDTVRYQICLDPFFKNEGANPPRVGTTMGLEMPCSYWDTGFSVIFPVKSLADFNSPDAQTAKQIMRSFNSL